MKLSRTLFFSTALLGSLVSWPTLAANASIRDLPADVQRTMLSLFKNEMPADASGDFNSTDVEEERLPMRRVIFTATQGPVHFVYYEHGGYSYHTHLVGVQSGNPRIQINVIFFHTYRTLNEVKAALRGLHFYSSDEY